MKRTLMTLHIVAVMVTTIVMLSQQVNAQTSDIIATKAPYGEIVLSQTLHQASGKKIQCNIEPNGDNSVIICYAFPSMKVTKLNEEGLVNCSFDDFGVNTNPEFAALPQRFDSFEIPQGYELKLNVTEADYIDFKYDVAYACDPIYDSEELSSDIHYKKAETTGFYPSNLVLQVDEKMYRGHRIAYVRVSPMQYNSSTSTLRVYRKLAYEVSFVHKSVNQQLCMVNNDSPRFICNEISTQDWLKENLTYFDNKQGNITSPNLSAAHPYEAINAPLYLIISNPKLKNAVEKFADYKRMTGFNVNVEYRSYWTPSAIRKFICDEIDNGNYPRALLLFGDNAMVPCKMIQSPQSVNEFQYTDMYYACIDNDTDNLPDFPYGRIAASSEQEANDIVTKLIRYDSQPSTNESLYKLSGIIGFFQADINNLQKEENAYNFIQTAEKLYNHINSSGLNLGYRLYSTEPDVVPQFYSDGTPLPSDLVSSKWDGNFEKIRSMINYFNMIFYCGHGKENGFINNCVTKPKEEVCILSSSDLTKFYNIYKHPIVWATTCLTGKFNNYQERCFAQEFIKHPNTGAIGVYAANRETHNSFNNSLRYEIAKCVFPTTTNENAPKIAYRRHPGNIILSVLQNVIKDIGDRLIYREAYHYFGDPMMDLYISVPSPGLYSKSFNVNSSGLGCIQIDTPNHSIITFFNKKTKKVRYSNGKKSTYNLSSDESQDDICISVRPSHGYPTFDNAADLLNMNYDTENGSVSNFKLKGKFSNIATDGKTAKIAFTLENKESNSYIRLINIATNKQYNIPLNNNTDSISFDAPQSGLYVALLIVDGEVADSRKLIMK